MVKCRIGEERATAIQLMRKFIAYQFTDEVTLPINVLQKLCFKCSEYENWGYSFKAPLPEWKSFKNGLNFCVTNIFCDSIMFYTNYASSAQNRKINWGYSFKAPFPELKSFKNGLNYCVINIFFDSKLHL